MSRAIQETLSQELKNECEDILRKLITQYEFLNIGSDNFDKWDTNDAENLIADLIQLIQKSDAIDHAIITTDWGK